MRTFTVNEITETRLMVLLAVLYSGQELHRYDEQHEVLSFLCVCDMISDNEQLNITNVTPKISGCTNLTTKVSETSL